MTADLDPVLMPEWCYLYLLRTLMPKRRFRRWRGRRKALRRAARR